MTSTSAARRPTLCSSIVTGAGLALALSTASCGGPAGGAEGAATPPPGEKTVDPAPAATTDAKAAPPPAPAEAKVKLALPPVEIEAAEEPLKLGGKDVTAELCALDTSAPEMKATSFASAIRPLTVLPDGALIVIDHEGKLRKYVARKGDKCELALDTSFGQNGVLTVTDELTSLAAAPNGRLFAWSWSKLHRIDGNKAEASQCSVKAIDPGGTIGFSSFGTEITKLKLDAECAEEKWPVKGLTDKDASISLISPLPGGDVALSVSKKGSYFVGLHGPDGKQKLKLGGAKDGDEQICNVNDVEPCAQGLCVLDGNCRSIRAWDAKKGTFVGAIKVGDLLGVSYPWPVDIAMGKGVAYMTATHAGKDEGDERSYGMIFRIKGLN